MACGMTKTFEAIAAIKPDYMGFIFLGTLFRICQIEPPLSFQDIKKVGVFVNASIDTIVETNQRLTICKQFNCMAKKRLNFANLLQAFRCRGHQSLFH